MIWICILHYCWALRLLSYNRVPLPSTYCLPSTALIALNLPAYCPLTEFSNQPYEINAIAILFLQTGLLRYRDVMQSIGDVSRMPSEAGHLESVFLTPWQWVLGSYVLEPAGTVFFFFFFFNVGLPLPWWSKNVAKNLPKQGTQVQTLVWEDSIYLRAQLSPCSLTTESILELPYSTREVTAIRSPFPTSRV